MHALCLRIYMVSSCQSIRRNQGISCCQAYLCNLNLKGHDFGVKWVSRSNWYDAFHWVSMCVQTSQLTTCMLLWKMTFTNRYVYGEMNEYKLIYIANLNFAWQYIIFSWASLLDDRFRYIHIWSDEHADT